MKVARLTAGCRWLTAMFSKTVAHPPLRAASLYRIFADEAITNQFIVPLSSECKNLAANHAPGFLLTTYSKRESSSVHFPLAWNRYIDQKTNSS